MSLAATTDPLTNSSCSFILPACCCSLCITFVSAPICTLTADRSLSSLPTASFSTPWSLTLCCSSSVFASFSPSSLLATASSSPSSFFWYASCLVLNLVSMTNLRLRYSSSVLSSTPNSLSPAAICSSALMAPLRRCTSSWKLCLLASICASRSPLSWRSRVARSISLSSFFSISSLSCSSFDMKSSSLSRDLWHASRLPMASSRDSMRYSSWSSLFLLSLLVAPSFASTFSTRACRLFLLFSRSSTSLPFSSCSSCLALTPWSSLAETVVCSLSSFRLKSSSDSRPPSAGEFRLLISTARSLLLPSEGSDSPFLLL
mmetsp:Transcript_929/g.2244  ORF Transcript_929/g.2244 Transcript_929/m.2244 type:complete len:317 (+) Transcript_929:1440-2390(+)